MDFAGVLGLSVRVVARWSLMPWDSFTPGLGLGLAAPPPRAQRSNLISRAATPPTSTPTGSPSPGFGASPAVPPPVPRVFPPEDWHGVLPHVLAAITRRIIPRRRHRTCPRAVKRGRHNHYPVKKPSHRSSTRHTGPLTINIHRLIPQAT
jgi:hypothetical protein